MRVDIDKLEALKKNFPHTTPTGHTYNEPTDFKELSEWVMNRAQGSIECWDDAELPPDETPAMFTIAWNTALRATEQNAELVREARELRGIAEAARVIMRGIDSHHPKWLEMGRFDLATSEVNPLRDALARYDAGVTP
jgi:hypothetical protein